MSRPLLALVILCGLTPVDRAAAQFLGKDAAGWTSALESDDVRTRRSAAFALGKLGSAATLAVPALQRTLTGDGDAKVREAAAFALGEIGQGVQRAKNAPSLGRTLVGALMAALADPDPLVRRSALYALGSQADATGARSEVEKLLDDRAPEVRQNAAWALGRMGSDAIPRLGRALHDPDTLVKRDAAGSLELIARVDSDGVRTVLADLAPLSRNADVEVKKSALNAINWCLSRKDAKNESIIGPVRAALLDGDLEVQRMAAIALSNVGGDVAAPALDVLVGALRNGDPELKRQAASSLRNLGSHALRALPDLQEALRQKQDPQLRNAAALALGGLRKLAAPAIPALADMVADVREPAENRAEAATTLSYIGKENGAREIVPRLLGVLTNPREDENVRQRVLWSLRVHGRELGDIKGIMPAFRQVLGEKATEENRLLRYDCAYLMGMVLGEKAPPEVFPVLLDYLKYDKLQIYRNKAIVVQGGGFETSGRGTTSREIGDGDGRSMAVHALEQIGPDVVRLHPEIVDQLRRLAADERGIANFRRQCREFLSLLQQ